MAVEDGSETRQSFVEFVMAYEDTKPRFEAFIKHVLRESLKGWDKELLSPQWMQEQAAFWIPRFFDPEAGEFGSGLAMDLARIARHIAQKRTEPIFHSFNERASCDLDAIARKRLSNNSLENDEFLRREFSKAGGLWKVFYKSYERFATAFDGAMRRELYRKRHGTITRAVPSIPTEPRKRRELTKEEQEQVKRRDGYACLCCRGRGRGVKLQIDHIVAYALGGETSVENSQTLCSVCNRARKINELNLFQTATLLPAPLELELLARPGSEDVRRTIARLVNYFYRCRAVCDVRIHDRSNGRFYSTWEVELYGGNDPAWLNQHRGALLAHIQEEYGCPHVTNVKVLGPGVGKR